MPLSWFRVPTEADAGSTNLCHHALDLPVVRGFAGQDAVRSGADVLDYAQLLERVAALGGAMKALGAKKGEPVGILLDDPLDELWAFLACLRLGAVPVALPPEDAEEAIDRHTPALVVTSRVLVAGHTPGAVILRGPDPRDERRDLDWDLALRAGRTDPAATEPVPGDTTAYVLDRAVLVRDVLDDDSWLAGHLRDLGEGRGVVLDPSARD